MSYTGSKVSGLESGAVQREQDTCWREGLEHFTVG